jgi:hypothetical protein
MITTPPCSRTYSTFARRMQQTPSKNRPSQSRCGLFARRSTRCDPTRRGYFFFFIYTIHIMTSWRTTFDITPSNDLESVKRKYKKLALEKHPDKGGSKENFQKLAANWESARQHYERSSHAGASHAGASHAGASHAGASDFFPSNEFIVTPYVAGRTAGYQMAPFLNIRNGDTVRSLFDRIVQHAKDIETLIGLDVFDGFKVIFSRFHGRDRHLVYSEPSDETIVRGAFEVMVMVRQKRQSKTGWYYPRDTRNTGRPTSSGPPTVDVKIQSSLEENRFGNSFQKIISLPKTVTVKQLYDAVAEKLQLTDDFSLAWIPSRADQRSADRTRQYFGLSSHHSQDLKRRFTTPRPLLLTTAKTIRARTREPTTYYRPSTGRFYVSRRRQRKPNKFDTDRPVRFRGGTRLVHTTPVHITRRGNIHGESVRGTLWKRKRVEPTVPPGRTGIRRSSIKRIKRT